MKKFVFLSHSLALATGSLLNPATGHNATTWLRAAGAGSVRVALWVYRPCACPAAALVPSARPAMV